MTLFALARAERTPITQYSLINGIKKIVKNLSFKLIKKVIFVYARDIKEW